MSPPVFPLLLLPLLLPATAVSLWCGYRPEWRHSFSTINYVDNEDNVNSTNLLDMDTGVFTVAGVGNFYVTVTAAVGGMLLPHGQGDVLHKPAPVYGQIFLKKSGEWFQ